MPSQFGGTWTIVSVLFENHENPQYGYDLMGFGKSADSLKIGDTICGYITTKNYNSKKDGSLRTSYTFNKMSAEYVYKLLLKMNPEIENIKTSASVRTTPPVQRVVEQPDDIQPDWGDQGNDPGF